MINRKIILSSVIAGVVSLSASHHVTAALPNFQQGQEGVHVNNQNIQRVQQFQDERGKPTSFSATPEFQNERGKLTPFYAMQVALHMSDKQKLSEFAQISKKYNKAVKGLHFNPFPVTSENYPNIHNNLNNLNTQVFYADNDFGLTTYKGNANSKISQARFEYPVSYAEAQYIVALDGQHYNTMRFKNVSMSINDALAIPLGAKGGQYALHYREVDGINRFYLDKAETQEILIKTLTGEYNEANGAIVDLSRFHHLSSIRSNMFLYCKNITSVKFPKNLREIRSECFRGCNALTSINLEKIHVISSRAFFGCENLKLTKESLKNAEIIYNYAFSSRQGVTIDELDLRNLTSIQRAFTGRGLQGVTLSENMYDRVPEDAFDEKVVITYVNSAGKVTEQETLAETTTRQENLFKDFRNLFK